MAAEQTHEGTLAPGETHAEGGLPQMNVDTYASQIFWLVLTFSFLLIVLSRVLLPNIRQGMEGRQSKIQGDLDSAEELGRQAAASLEAYEASLSSARGKALALADENRKGVLATIEGEKAEADAKSQTAMAEAERKIEAARTEAVSHVRETARDAAIDIVERLIGERVSDSDAEKAIEARS